MTTLITNVLLTDGATRNVLAEDGVYVCTDASDGAVADTVIDGTGKALLPAFYNAHNHAAMAWLRGYADDMPLKEWLTEHIWPFEGTMGAKEIHDGSVLAVNEMVSTGTVFFNDMYFEIDETIRAAGEAGMRACIGVTFMDDHPLVLRAEKTKRMRGWKDMYDGRISLAAAPHSIYTASAGTLGYSTTLARECGMKIHIHVAETLEEVENCVRDHGATPVRYLDSLGLLGPDVIAAHCVHVDREEWDILAERGVTVCHCPCSNMKLGSGRFPYEEAISSGVRIVLGTDGCSSNNNMDMREEMKFAALFAKSSGDPSLLPASDVLRWATENGAEAFGIRGGRIEAGYVADGILVDLSSPKMLPCYNLVSNWVYAADSSCISAVLCDGKVIYSR